MQKKYFCTQQDLFDTNIEEDKTNTKKRRVKRQEIPIDNIDEDIDTEINEKKKGKNLENEDRENIKKKDDAKFDPNNINPVSIYNQFIKACIISGEYEEAAKILMLMPKEGFKTRTSMYNLVLVALAQKGMVDKVNELINSMTENNIPKNKNTMTAVTKANRIAEGKDGKKESEEKAEEEKEIAVHDKTLHPLDYDNKESDRYLEDLQFEHLIEVMDDPKERALFSKQIQLETRAISDSVEKYNEQIKNLTSIRKGANPSPGQRLLLYWYEPVSYAISEYQKSLLKEQKVKEASFLLTELDPGKLAVIVMHEVLSSLLASPVGGKFTKIALDVGCAVQAEVNIEKIKVEKVRLFKRMKEDGRLWNVRSVLKRSKAVFEDDVWDQETCLRIGAILIKILLNNAYISDIILRKNFIRLEEDTSPKKLAFSHYYLKEPRKRIGMLKLEDEVVRVIDAIHLMQNCVHARYLPMLVPPRPWTTPRKGGYLTTTSPVMRFKGSRLQNQLLEDANDLSKIYTPLNILAQTAWTINNKVYDVIDEAWKNGGGIADLPTHSNIDIPAPPDFETFKMEKRRWFNQEKNIRQLNWDRHGLRCETNYKLAVAHEFKNVPFYFPHNVDFRGRAYPIPPYLNQMGNDLCRSLLLFHEGKPLGKNGLNWLKIHLSNLCGINKVSFEERIKFTDDNMDSIFDSATNPLSGNKWWLKAEEPWQCLATCFEIKKALESGNVEEYITHLPVHQDGSCNGLQHYAALGGDILGAQQVNLLPSDKPQDVYSGVAAIVSKIVDRDALNGDPIAQKLKGKIVRKILKQTVMTSVYGVTMPGARKQILNAMKAVKIQGFDMTTNDDSELFKASYYLATLTFEALREMFKVARNIMEWLATCSKLIATQGKPVYWVTPLGLPVVQPYRKMGDKAIKTVVQIIVLESDNDKLPISIARQKSAFPPNYVHSLDSTHMMLTAMACNQEGITFSSVHDSYWCHPCNAERMNEILREQFVQLHQQPLLHQLRDHFVRTYDNIEFPPVPEKGDLDLTEVQKSTYFFH